MVRIIAIIVTLIACRVQQWNAESHKVFSVDGPLNPTEVVIYGIGRMAMSRGTLGMWEARTTTIE
jgi:hypothetical protein